MKNILVILLSLFTFTCFSQDSYQSFDFTPVKEVQTTKVQLNLPPYDSSPQSRISVGGGMLMGGGAFILAGVLTPPVYVGGSTTEKKPFYSQPRFYPIVTGALVMFVGVTISL